MMGIPGHALAIKTLCLHRIASRPDGTFGVLMADNNPFAVTLERPWRENRKGESCIPAGHYHCRRVQSPKFGDTFEVCDVPGRSHILFHRGNTFADSHGCILVAESFAIWADGSTSIKDSVGGFADFHYMTRGIDAFALEISERLAP